MDKNNSQSTKKMRVDERRLAILDEVQQQERVVVTDLSDRFGVSQVIIRRDLENLDQRGLLKRIHGGALAISGNSQQSIFELRLLKNYAIKKKLGAAAAQLISPGSTILIDAGTTVLEIARHLPRSLLENDQLTIVTRSLNIAWEIRRLIQIRLILLGGIYSYEYDNFVGAQVENDLKSFHFDTVFLGADGVTVDRGVSTDNVMEAGLYRLTAANADQVVVVTDSSKIGINTLQAILSFDQINTFITDEGAPTNFIQTLQEHQVNTILVSLPDETIETRKKGI